LENKSICVTENALDEILIEDIFDNKGNILIAKNAIMNKYSVELLSRSNIKEIYVYPSKEESRLSKNNNFPLIYKENILAMQKIARRLAAGKGVAPDDLGEMSKILSIEINKNSKMIGHTGRIKDTDEYTYNHSVNVAIYSVYIGRLLGLDDGRLRELCQAALLHDIGKAKVPKDILNKKGKLTKEEFSIVKKHTIDGYVLSKGMSFLTEEVRDAILCHHEREDGSGYPYGIKGRKINLYAKILAITDVYDALTSERAYKKKSTPFDAIEEFYNMGINKFSRPILNIFLKNISQLYVNSKVILNDGRVGKIEFIPPKDLIFPIINIHGEYIDLSTNPSLKIIGIVE